jgi:Rieske Fe-S protein
MAITRRDFLQHSAVAVGGVTLAGGCGNPVDAPPLVRATIGWDPTDTKSFGTVRIDLSAIADLALVGGAVTVQLDADPTPLLLKPFKMPSGGALLVVHRGQIGAPDEYIAVDSGCPHASCPLGYSAASDLIECPCHSSRFRAAFAGNGTCVGEKMHGPSRIDVPAYQTALEGLKTLVIDLKVINDCGTVHLPPIVGGMMTLTVAQYPALANVGGSIVGRPTGSANAVALVRTNATTIAALSAVCTHLGCTVAYADGNTMTSCGPVAGGGFWCSCHCSKFALDGTVLVGPASQPLKKYASTFDGTTLAVTIPIV